MPAQLVFAAVAGVLVGIAATVLMLVRLVQIARQDELGRAPIVAEQDVQLAEAGRAELAVEGPLFTTRLRGLTFELIERATGAAVALERLWFRTTSGGFGRTRLSLHRLEVPVSGTYRLRIGGVVPDADYARCAVVFVRPRAAGIALTIVGLLAAIGLTGGSLAVAGALLARDPTPELPSVVVETPPTLPPVVASGGRALAAEPVRLSAAQEIIWPPLEIRVRAPRDWVVRKLTAGELDLRDPTTPSTFVVGHASPMPAGPAANEYLEAQVEHARQQLAAGQIEGYATKPLNGVPGVVTVARRLGGETIATWTGFLPIEGSTISVTFLLGAAATDFARDEGLLGAILESIRVG